MNMHNNTGKERILLLRKSSIIFLMTAVFMFVVFVVLLDVLMHFDIIEVPREIRKLFRVYSEKSIVTYISIILFFSIGILSGLHASISKKWRLLFWGGMAMLFFFFSLDDAIMLHERLSNLVEDNSGQPESQQSVFDKFPSYIWLLLYLPFLVLFGGFMIVILWREFSFPLLRFLLFGCFVCYGGALVLEYFEGMNDAHKYMAELLAVRYKHVRYSSKALEELLEMVGTASLLLAVALHGVDRMNPGLEIRVLDHQARSPDETATR